ncbi:uncharacterized protein LOC127717934 isoform X2 [Mytilus californianus]|nr:uncharacterized protein LOC127717934 isoform X2 [Mytilus californianus]
MKTFNSCMAKGDNHQFRNEVLIILVMNSIVTTKGLVILELDSKPAIFGTNFRLKCIISEVSCCSTFTRKWTKGDNYHLIVINSLSSNTSKYKEDLNVATKTSILTIRNLTKEDVNIPYECTYGFDTDSKLLSLNSTDFEYHPTEDVPVKLHISRNQIATANVSFNKVYPIPVCFATDDGSNVSHHLSVENERTGLFYRSNLQFQYQLVDNCYQNISIICTVGTTHLTVVNSTLPCSSKLEQRMIEVVAIIISASWIPMGIVALILLLCLQRKCT